MAQSSSVAVERTGPAVALDAEPPATATALFRVINTTDRTVRLDPRIEVPRGWRPIAAPEPTELAPGVARQRIVSVRVPSGARPGTYAIRYRVTPDEGASSEDSIRVVVRERRAVEVAPMGAPRFVVAGRRYRASFAVSNRGNADARVRLRVQGNEGVAIEPETAVLRLAPGESEPIEIEAMPPADLDRRITHVITLRARLDDDSTVAATATSRVNIAPPVTRSTERGRRLPVELRLRAAETWNRRPPIELSGAGALTTSGFPRLRFRLRGPRPAHPALGERDEYHIGLHGQSYDLQIGDGQYSLSPLTELGRYASGMGGNARIGPVEARAFIARNRYLSSGELQHGIGVGYRLPGRGNVQLNHLRGPAGSGPGAWTVRSRVTPLDRTTLDLEYGLGFQSGGLPRARRILLSSRHDRYGYEIRHVRADDDYPGDYRGVAHDYASVNVAPWRSLRIFGSASRYDQSPPASAAAPDAFRRSRSYRARIGYGRHISLEYRRDDRAGRVVGYGYDELAQTLSARLSLGLDRIRLYSTAEIGQRFDRRDGQREPFRRLALRSSFSAAGASYTAAFQHVTRGALGARNPRHRLSGHLNATANLRPDTRLRVALRGRTSQFGWTRSYGRVDAGVEHRLANNHQLGVRLRVAGASNGHTRDDPLLYLDYTIPFTLPTLDARSPGRFTGRVYDAETGRGLADVPVRLGEQLAITDDSGQATFTRVPPGTYSLDVDRPSIGLDRIPHIDLPRSVAIHSGETTRLDVGFARSASIAGTARIIVKEGDAPTPHRTDPPSEPVIAEAVSGVVLEISNERRVVRRITDARGRFRFTDLVPGRWTLAVLHAPVPAQHTLEQDTFRIELEPGEKEPVDITIQPKDRPLRIIEQQRITPDTTSIPDDTADAAPAPAAAAGTPTGRSTPGASGRPEAGNVGRYLATDGSAGVGRIARIVYEDDSLRPKPWAVNRHRVPDSDTVRRGHVPRIPLEAPPTESRRNARAEYGERGAQGR